MLPQSVLEVIAYESLNKTVKDRKLCSCPESIWMGGKTERHESSDSIIKTGLQGNYSAVQTFYCFMENRIPLSGKRRRIFYSLTLK